MKQLNSDFFEVKVRRLMTQEDGSEKTVTETYAVDAKSFTEAEAMMVGEFDGDYSIKAIAIAPYRTVLIDAEGDVAKFFKSKVVFSTINEKTEKEKKHTEYYLVDAESLETARKTVESFLSGTVTAYEISAITESPVKEVLEHEG